MRNSGNEEALISPGVVTSSNQWRVMVEARQSQERKEAILAVEDDIQMSKIVNEPIMELYIHKLQRSSDRRKYMEISSDIEHVYK